MANEPNEEEEQPLRHAATYTQAPKVSHKVLTKEERQTLIKEHEAQQQEAAKLDEAASKGRIGRWWSRLQSGPDKITPAMAIVALGVVYGDIGTSPLYTMQTFLNGQGGLAHTDRAAVLGILSLVFWSITLITTVKYVFIAMRIDNNGEGGIFALYSLIRKYGAWLAIPAMLGGAAFLADSVLTPAVSISSAVEGLETLPLLEPIMSENKELTLMITIVIIVCLFAVQSRGTERIGRTFGTVVMIWFSFLAVVGLVNLSSDWSVLEALNPVYGVEFLFSHHNAAGLAVMGTVFLSTTGAEALYSDMGHVGRGNIYFTWPFIKIALVLCYFGQGAWMLNHWDDTAYNHMHGLNPFFEMMTPSVRYVAVLLSVCAGVIASQALITGAYTMVSEATRLNWMPHLQVRYPARTRGQLYIPVVNAVLCVSTLLVLAMFRDSEHISAAYGLALTVTMITTTILLAVYIWHDGKRVGAVVFTVVFLAIQVLFFFASMASTKASAAILPSLYLAELGSTGRGAFFTSSAMFVPPCFLSSFIICVLLTRSLICWPASRRTGPRRWRRNTGPAGHRKFPRPAPGPYSGVPPRCGPHRRTCTHAPRYRHDGPETPRGWPRSDRYRPPDRAALCRWPAD